MAEPPPPYVCNERGKSVSRSLFQLGTALLGGDAVKTYNEAEIAIEAVIWLGASVLLIWTGWLILGLLEPEK